MASDDTYEDEFQLVNEFENLNNDNELSNEENNNGNKGRSYGRSSAQHKNINENDNDDEDNDEGDEDEDDDEDDMVNISQMKSLKQEITKQMETLKLQTKNKEKEYESINNLKKELQLKLNEQNEIIEKSQQMFNTLKQQTNEYNQLSVTMKKEMENLKLLRSSVEEEKKRFQVELDKLEKEKKEFEKNNNELKNILSKLNKTSEFQSKNEEICQQLNQLLTNDHSQIQQEVTRLRQLRQQQQELINQAKSEVETLQSTHNAQLLTKLDPSQAYCCKDCGTHIALETDVESRCYQVGQGAFTEKKRGYLFKNAHNLVLGALKTENFTTGAYNISWVSCVKCQQQIGWKYISADNPTNTSKVGKYCLARYLLTAPPDSKDKDIPTSGSSATGTTTGTSSSTTNTTTTSNISNFNLF